MEIRHLRYFVTLAEEANFRRAAERLGIAQPPLSRQIRGLEDELGCRLMLRTPRGVTLTAAGVAFLEQARITLEAAQRAVDRARMAAPETADSLVLGCEPTADLAIVRRALERLASRHPTMTVELHTQSAADGMRTLHDGVTQAVVLALPVSATGGVHVEPVATVPLCLAVATGHRLAGPRPVSWRRLAEASFVSFARESAPVLFDAVVRTCRQESITLRPRHRATDLTAALTLVGAGLGVTVLPSGWQPPRSLGVTCRPLRPPVATIELGIAYRTDAATPAVMHLVHAARSVAADAAPPMRSRARARAAS